VLSEQGQGENEDARSGDNARRGARQREQSSRSARMAWLQEGELRGESGGRREERLGKQPWEQGSSAVEVLTLFRSAKYSRRTSGGALWSGAARTVRGTGPDGPRPGARARVPCLTTGRSAP
jgi:hypothetical protein